MVAYRTRPEPSQPGPGVDNIVTLGASLIYNDTLSGGPSPYRGKYYELDTSNFAFIVHELSKEGCFQASNLNSDIDFASTLRPFLRDGDVLDDRWTCAGLTPVFLHVGRALVHLSYLWNRKRPASVDTDAEAQQCLEPRFVYKRVVNDLSVALYIEPAVVRLLLGPRKACHRDLKNTMLFPDVEWCPMPFRSTRPHLLWDALRLTSPPQGSVAASPLQAKRERAGKSKIADDDSDYEPVPRTRRR